MSDIVTRSSFAVGMKPELDLVVLEKEIDMIYMIVQETAICTTTDLCPYLMIEPHLTRGMTEWYTL